MPDLPQALISRKIFINTLSYDETTNELIRYLLSSGTKSADIIRLNLGNTIELNTYLLGTNQEKSDAEFQVNKTNQSPASSNSNTTKFKLSELKAYWFRKGDLGLKALSYLPNELPSQQDKNISQVLDREKKALKSHLNNCLTNVPKALDNLTLAQDSNKITQLEFAQKVGLQIPETLITTKRQEALMFFKKHQGKLITKGINELLVVAKGIDHYATGTNKVKASDIQLLPDSFYPTLFQKLEEKRYEIRSFYFFGEIYSIAIFSQEDAQTKIDFRNYNDQTPNRNIPFILPNGIKEKTIQLVKQLGLDSCSLDFIVTPTGEFIFLEVNPVGQFGMVSYPGNYYLENKVAEYLGK